MEYVIGPVLSLLLALKIGDYNTKKREAEIKALNEKIEQIDKACLLYTSPSPRDRQKSRMPSSA